MSTLLRQHAEQQFAEELHELKKNETNPIPENWEMSPQSVVTYLMGGTLKNGFEISPKYIGNRRLMEIAVATLVTDRALLLYGLPGTAKSWVSEHMAAAISGDSTLIVQGTAGTGEEAIRYGQDRPYRGTYTHRFRRAGYAHHHPFGEDPTHP